MKGKWFVAGWVGLKTGSLAPQVFISPGETLKTLGWKNDRRSAGSLDSSTQQPSDLPSVFPFRSRERPPLLRLPLSPFPFPARFLSLPMQDNSQTQGLLSHRWLQPVLRQPPKAGNTNTRSRLERQSAEIRRHVDQPMRNHLHLQWGQRDKSLRGFALKGKLER